MKNNSSQKAYEYMEAHPDWVFIPFTHMDKRRFWQPDYLIRKFIARVPRYRRAGVNVHNTFSHVGMVFSGQDRLRYLHQTYPVFRDDDWSFRAYNLIFVVKDPSTVEEARRRAENLLASRKGYGIGKLLSFAFSIWFTWLRNPIVAGKVCSGAVAHCFPVWVPESEVNDIDPQGLAMLLKKAGVPFFLVDRRQVWYHE